MEKNIWEYVMNNKGEVIEKVADYIGVKSFAKTIEGLYRECLENFDDAEDMEEYIADLYGKNIQSMAWEFTLKVNREMKKYLHLNDQRMDGNFANLYNDYPRHVTGTFWATDYDGDDYYMTCILRWLPAWMPQRTASRLARTERTSKNGISKHSVRTTSSIISRTNLKRFTL